MTAPSSLVLSHLFPNPLRPGSGPFVVDQVQALKNDFRVGVVAPVRWVPPIPVARWNEERSVARNEVVDGVDVFRPRSLALPFGNLGIESRLMVSTVRPLVRQLVDERNIRLIHAVFALPNGFVAAKLAAELGIKVAVTVCGSDLLIFGQRPRLRRYLAETLRGADVVIAVSDELAERAVELGADAGSVRTTVSGVPDVFGNRLDRAAARAQLSVPPDVPLIVWVGGLVPVKQPLHALAAFKRLHKRLPDARLAIVGDGPLRARVERWLRNEELRDAASMLGYLARDEVRVWLAAADVLCSSSASEGTPGVVLEALVSGTPVVGYAVGGIPAVLERTDGGLAIPAGDTSALADGLASELTRDRRSDRVARAAKPFLLSNAIDPIRRAYEDALYG